MRHVLAFAALVLMVAFVPARADEAGKASSKDTKFVNEATTGGELEVALGKLAATKASSDDVKKFGQQMVDDHSKANDELRSLAKGKGIDLTEAKDKATKMESKAEGKLAKKEGAAFDKAYMDLMVKDHEDDVKEFEKASKNADDADLKAWAGKTLPTLESHLKMAKDIKAKLK
jgi:putative membrane protein